MVSGVDFDVLVKSGKYPCAVCCKGIGNNSIECSQCKPWVRKWCSGITGWLVADPNYICPRCSIMSQPIDSMPIMQVNAEGTKLDVEATFCYLGDMLCSSGGCDSAIATRSYVAWGKFRKLLPVLTSRHLSPKVCGRVYTACVHSAKCQGSKKWEPNTSDLEWLCHNDCAMICWICHITMMS